MCLWGSSFFAVFITFPIAKSQTRNKHDKDMSKGGSVYMERGELAILESIAHVPLVNETLHRQRAGFKSQRG
jgi:hypothetical protein